MGEIHSKGNKYGVFLLNMVLFCTNIINMGDFCPIFIGF